MKVYKNLLEAIGEIYIGEDGRHLYDYATEYDFEFNAYISVKYDTSNHTHYRDIELDNLHIVTKDGDFEPETVDVSRKEELLILDALMQKIDLY